MTSFKTMILLCCTLFTTANSLLAQDDEAFKYPVTWEYTAKRVSDSAIELQLTGAIDNGWKLHKTVELDDGPIPFYFAIDKNEGFEVLEPLNFGTTTVKAFDEIFKMNVEYFKKEIICTQRITFAADAVPTTVTLSFEYMACTDEKCLPPMLTCVDFELDNIKINTTKAGVEIECY